MRYLLTLLLSSLLFAHLAPAHAQTTASRIPIASVPQPVLTAWQTQFPGTAAATWSLVEREGKKLYTARFLKENKVARARFSAEGTYRWVSVHHTVSQTPGELSKAATTANPGFLLRWAKMITKAKDGFTYYKVRMAKGSTTLTTYFDSSFQPLERGKVQSTAGDIENETNGDKE